MNRIVKICPGKLRSVQNARAILAMSFALFLPASPCAVAQNSVGSAPRTSLGAVGRTLSLDSICGECKVEKFTDACLGRLEAPNFDGEGNLWLVSHATGEIYRVTPDGRCEEIAYTSAPNGLRFHKDGRLFGVDHHLGIFWLDTKTREITFLTNEFHSGNFAGLDDLFFDKTGGLYMTDAWGSSVLKPSGHVFYLSAGGKLSRPISGNLAFPNGVVLSPDERTLYVDDFGTNRILAVPVESPGVLNVEGAWVFAYLNGGHGPDSLTADANGNLYVAHHSAGEVVVFNPRGFSTAPSGCLKAQVWCLRMSRFTMAICTLQKWISTRSGVSKPKYLD